MSILDEGTLEKYHKLVSVSENEYNDESIKQALQQLPIFERTCLLLEIEGEFTVEDIADIVDQSQEDVAAAIGDAREHVYQHYHVIKKPTPKRLCWPMTLAMEPGQTTMNKLLRTGLEMSRVLAQSRPFSTCNVIGQQSPKRPARGGTGPRGHMHFPSKSRLVLLIAAVILVAILILPLGIPFGPAAQAETFSLDMPSKTQTIYRLAWAHTVAWSPNGEDIATLWSDNTLQVWNARDGIESFHASNIGWGAGLAFSPDGGTYLASVDTDTTFQLFNVAACKVQPGACQPLRIYQGHKGPIEALSWSPDGTKIASASDDGTVRIWDVQTGKTLSVYQDQTPQAHFTAVAWSPNSKHIVSGDDRGHVQIWDALTGHLLLTYLGHYNDPVTFVSWSHDSNDVASSGYKGIARIWNAQTGQTIASIPGTENGSVKGSGNDPIYAFVWSHSRPLVAIASYDTIQVWDLSTGKPQQIGDGYHPSAHPSDKAFGHAPGKGEANMFTVAWSPDDKQIVCGGQGYTLRLNSHG
ncbi:MAG TPA: hypothetical protein VHV10_07720 [Ktedonobacteraceae bacterium]|jgi:Tol biopolymer transport system component|nr:hypothetical protein [Ktedonobacteraceae bacterium]